MTKHFRFSASKIFISEAVGLEVVIDGGHRLMASEVVAQQEGVDFDEGEFQRQQCKRSAAESADRAEELVQSGEDRYE